MNRTAFIAMACVCTLLLGASVGRQPAADRKCVAAFCCEALMVGHAGTAKNTAIDGRFLTGMPGSTVQMKADGRAVRPERPHVIRQGPNGETYVDGKLQKGKPEGEPAVGDPDQWKSLGIFRAWDDGSVDEMHYNTKTGLRAWLTSD